MYENVHCNLALVLLLVRTEVQCGKVYEPIMDFVYRRLYNPSLRAGSLYSGLQHTKGLGWGNYDCCTNVIFTYPKFTELVFKWSYFETEL